MFFALPGFAQFRKYSNEFLNIGAGARGLAMGSAQVASVNDGTAGYWNPAGLYGVKDHPQRKPDALLNILQALVNMIMPVSLFLSANNKRTIGITGFVLLWMIS